MSQPIEPTQTTPADPMTLMAEGAVQLHELFTSYVGAGFTEPQAMQIILSLLAEHARNQAGA